MERVKIVILPALLCLGLLLLAGAEVRAGCGCDHPTPCPAPVMPGFASPGDRIRLNGSGFITGWHGNTVEYYSSFGVELALAKARTSEMLFVNTPDGLLSRSKVGPMRIEVRSGFKKNKYTKDDFTYLDVPLPLEEGSGHYIFEGYRPAVDTFGVMYVPLDLSRIQAATNFLVFVENLPLAFAEEDVVLYNKDGFNLNLFTLDVEGYEKQWGAWYGVQSLEGANPRHSSLLTYWRHDFYAYTAAHQPGGAYAVHEETQDGYLLHADGTLHVDHDRLIAAVSGRLRDPKNPDQPATGTLKPGAVDNVRIHVLQLNTEDPNAWTNLSEEQQQILASNLKVKKADASGFISLDPFNLMGYDFGLPLLKKYLK